MSEYKLVPVEPTLDMLHAVLEQNRKENIIKIGAEYPIADAIYKAMLASCPDVSSEPVAKIIHTIGTGLLEGKTIPKVMLDAKYANLPKGTKLFTEPQPDRVAELEAKLAEYEKMRMAILVGNPIKELEAKLKVASRFIKQAIFILEESETNTPKIDTINLLGEALKQIGGTE
jgi:hypothetical protein